ncbi:MAG: hypothetical protein B6244_02015 [Candidatus Cloacimonetes bacterium 4572_55]|nr:MAG: hypothetical protein B6244_02015 [Candidatus Cloacimonetes bacterium 4572_55]
MNRSKVKYLPFIITKILIFAVFSSQSLQASSITDGISDFRDFNEISLEELLNIQIVTANKKEEGILESPSVVNVITADEIKLLNFKTLTEVLEYSVGISSNHAQALPIFVTSTIRGNTLVNFQTSSLLLFDGIPIYNPFHGSFDLSWIPLSSIERVEIVKGANSVLYGTNAMSAVINIISKKQSDDVELTGKVAIGQNKTIHGEWAHFKSFDQFDSRFFADITSIEGETFDSFNHKYESGEQETNFRNGSVVAKINYQDVEIHFQHFRREIKTMLTNWDTDDDKTVFTPWTFDESGFILNVDYRRQFSPKAMLHTHSHLFIWEMDRIYPYPITLVPDRMLYESSLYFGEVELTLSPIEKSENIIGVSLDILNGRRYKLLDDVYDIGADDEKTTNLSVYLNGNYRLSPQLNLFYGGRYYRSSIRGVGQSNFSKRVALTYQIFPNWYVKSMYGESFRVPTYPEKEVKMPQLVGNPELSPEKSTSYDALISGLVKGVQVNLDIFKLTIEDQIVRGLTPDSMKTYENSGELEYTGVELEFKFRFSDRTFGFGGYSYAEGRDKSAVINPTLADTTSGDLKYTYNNMVNFGISHVLTDQFTLTGSMKYLDQWQEADSYIVLNSGITFKPLPSLEIQLKVDNVLSQKIERPEQMYHSGYWEPVTWMEKPRVFMSVFYTY